MDENTDNRTESGAVRSRKLGRARRVRWGQSPVFNAIVALSLLASVLAVFEAVQPEVASAAVPPRLDTADTVATTDVLPSVQVDGIVWDQHVLGNTVYAVGQFSKARPAGSRLGTNEVPRSNILAYDIRTGELINSFAPVLNNDARVVTSAPDGSRIFVGGMFTSVNGINQYRITSLDPVTGAVDTAFSAVVDYRVSAITVTDTAVYVGGRFGSAASFSAPASPSTPRMNLAAFDRHTGSVLPWNPSADGEVLGLTSAVGGTRIFAAGRFGTVGGVTNKGTAAIDASGTGAVLNWPANSRVQASGKDAAIFSITSDGNDIYASGYHFGAGGNLEGTFSADAVTGELNWVQDCHGDTYDVAPVNGTVYTVSHAHYCANVGGFPQSNPWQINMRHALAFSAHATGTNRRDIWNYPNWEGTPAPSIVAWYPEFAVGTIAGQAGWTVEGNDDYVVIGGEFTRVNNVAQQGLVRFAKRAIAPRKQGPRLSGDNWDLNLQSYSQGEVRVSFNANFDRDNSELTYQVFRDGNFSQPVYETKMSSVFWDLPALGFTDKGLAPGSSHTYIVRAVDPDDNKAWSASKSITVASSGSSSPYADAILQDNPRLYWRFADASGSTTAASGAGLESGSVGNKSNVTFGGAGAMANESTDRSASFSNSLASHVTGAYTAVVDTFSIEAWVKTNATTGGRIMGFSSSEHGTSGSYDRLLYMNNNGSITFGAYPGATKTVTSQTGLNNNQWHHVVGTLGEDGMHLYVDGVLSSYNRGSDYTGGQGYYGYWRVGADTLSGWPGTRTRSYLTGSIDEPAVYYTVLSPSRVAAHYAASGRTPSLPAGPADSYGSMMRASDPVLYYRLSEASGTTAADSGIRSTTGTYVGTVGRSATGVIPGNTAAAFNGLGFVRSNNFYDPGHYSVQAWFKTNTSTGGQIIGFGNSTTGVSTTADRQVVMTNSGQLAFRSGGATVTTGSSYNDGTWHHVAATQGAEGMRLYVDGVLVASGARAVGSVYTGYWRIGGDNVAGLASSNNFNGLIDEAAVHDRVLTGQEVVGIFVAGGGQVPNVPPTASFTSSVNFLDVSVDASASGDVDGSIASYAWEFGDGATASGVTASHSYATAGTYTIKLTVTDDRGATATFTNDVTVAPEPPNVAPIADFSVTSTGLVAKTNASASLDPDGSIVSYDWDFGDGGTATGVSATHTYLSAGTKSISLTVTDNKGATGTITKQIAVEEPTGPTVYASDAFSRSTTNGWGEADLGGTWSTVGPVALFSTGGGVGEHRLDAAGRTTASYLNDVSATDTVATVDLSIDKPLTGGGLYTYVLVRNSGSTNYQLRIKAKSSGTNLTLMRSIDGTTTVLSSVDVPGLVLNQGNTYKILLSAKGTSPTSLGAKVWSADSTEPSMPQLTASDSTAALQGAGGVGMINYLTGSVTNAPVRVSYDNLIVASDSDAGPPTVPNVPPVAAFTASLLDHEVSVDASGSTDSDGSIVSYDWSFGDGATATGVTASHTYATGGLKTITLTVTDDDGDSATAVRNVTIDDGGIVLDAADAFERSVSNGWGSADLGGAWTTMGPASLFSVSSGAGTQTLDAAGRTVATYLDSLDKANVKASIDLSIDKPLTGSGIYSYIALRRVGTSEYSLRIRMKTTSTNLAILRTVNGASTVLASVDLPIVVSPGSGYRLSFRTAGSSPTQLSAKFWKIGDGEPLDDAVSASDATAVLQGSGGLGLTNYLAGSATNAPVVVKYDNLEVAPA